MIPGNYQPDEPGFVFSVNDNQGNIIFYITTQSPVFIASPNFSPLEIADSLLLNISQGHSDGFYIKILGNPITEDQKRNLVGGLEQLIPNTGHFFLSTKGLLTFISSFFTENVIVPTLVTIE